MFVLNEDPNDLHFPPVELASREGLLAMGGDLSIDRLLAAYRNGIFPWYNEGQPILWWSPDPRAVIVPERLNISHSLRKTLRTKKFEVSFDQCFARVMQECAAPRGNHADGGTWITDTMRDAYVALHERGNAHSVEAWRDGTLVGGLYGVSMGGIFFGESMFSREADASKVALAHAARQLQRWGYSLIDCQMPTPHLLRLGAQAVPRTLYLQFLQHALALPGRQDRWVFDSDLFIV